MDTSVSNAIIVPIIITKSGDTNAISKLQSEVNDLSNTLVKAQKQSDSSFSSMLNSMNKFRWTLVNTQYLFMQFSNTAGLAFKEGIPLAVEYQDALTKIQSISGELISSAEEVTKSLQSGRPTSLQNVAEAYLEVSKAGYSAADAISVTRDALNLAQLSGMNFSEASQELSQVIAEFNLKGSESQKVLDLLTSAASKTVASENSLTTALGYVGNSAAAAGTDLTQTIAILAQLQQAGLDSSRAGTALRQIFAELLDPSSKAEEVMRKLNLSLIDYSTGKNKDVISFFKELTLAMQRQGYTAADVQKTLGEMFDVRAMSAAQVLVTQLNQNINSLDDFKNSIIDVGSAQDKLAIQNESMANKLKKTNEEVKKSYTDFGQSVVDSITDQDLENWKQLNEAFINLGNSLLKLEPIASSVFGFISKMADIISDPSVQALIGGALMLTGVGEAALGVKALKGASELGTIAKIGAGAGKTIVGAGIAYGGLSSISTPDYNYTTAGTSTNYGPNVANVQFALMNASYTTTTKQLTDAETQYYNAYGRLKTDMMENNPFDEYANKSKKVSASIQGIVDSIDLMNSVLSTPELQNQTTLVDRYDSKIKQSEEDIVKFTAAKKEDQIKLDSASASYSSASTTLKEYNDVLSDLNSEYKKIQDARFVGETQTENILNLAETYQKKQELSTYGVADAQEYINDILGKTTTSYDELFSSISKVNSAYSNNSSAFDAWRTTIQEEIKAEVSAGQMLGKDVTSRTKIRQTELLGIQNSSGKTSSTALDDFINKLKLASDVYYGSMTNQVSNYVKTSEDSANGVYASAQQKIKELSEKGTSIEQYKNLVKEQENTVKQRQKAVNDLKIEIADDETALAKATEDLTTNMTALGSLIDTIVNPKPTYGPQKEPKYGPSREPLFDKEAYDKSIITGNTINLNVTTTPTMDELNKRIVEYYKSGRKV